jgi:nucleolar complex protein 3
MYLLELVFNDSLYQKQQTETLKLLFVVYFSILKAAKPSPLLSAALQGIARFAHMVNIDFFRDLLAVLREIMVRTSGVDDEEENDTEAPTIDQEERLRLQILCVLTAFELLTGQGV